MYTCTKEVIFTTFVVCLWITQVFTGDLQVNSGQNGRMDLPANAGKIFSLQQNEELILQLRRTRPSWSFLVFQAHSLHRETRASTDPSFSHGTTEVGRDASVLLKLPYMHGEQFFPFYLKSNSTEDYNVDVISVPYSDGVPFPGGCCLTCNMDLDPNLKVTYSSSLETTVQFSFANVFFSRNHKEVPCDGNTHPNSPPVHYRLEYHIYTMFLEEGNLQEEELFKGLEKMAYPGVIKTNGQKVSTLKAPTLPQVKFDSMAGQGVIYNIIVYDPIGKTESAYSPAHTYACSFTSTIGNCYSVVSTINKVFAVIGAVVACVMCFMGHRWFKLALFLGGLMNFGFIFYIILSESTSLSHTGLMLVSLFVGVLGGLVVFSLWWLTEYTRLCLLINGLFLGFVAAGLLLFTPAGDSDIWKNDFDYGMIVIAITIVVPFILLPWPKVLSIVYTSVVSSYGFIIGIDTLIHTSLSYLVLNIVIRAIEPNYSGVIVRRPFQYKDTILSSTWAALAVVGIVVQFVLARKRMDFPKSGYLEQKRIRKYYDNKEYDEKTPILINTEGYRHNDIC